MARAGRRQRTSAAYAEPQRFGSGTRQRHWTARLAPRPPFAPSARLTLVPPAVVAPAVPAATTRVGFLFNHEQIHQVAHALPIALALAERGFPGEIVVATSHAALTAEVRRLGGTAIGTRIQLVELGLPPAVRLLARSLGAFAPAATVLVYRHNLDFFRGLDVLVVPEKTSLLLKDRFGLDRLRIVHTRHGAGDRAIGFDAASARFDHVLCSGAKVRDRLVREAGVEPDRISVVGYPKFDVAPPASPALQAHDGRPIVLYNPHPSPHLSSWFRHGRAVLDFFLRHPEYRLVFAPHVMLFQRRVMVSIDRLRIGRAGRLEDRYLDAPNIHVDLGSSASTDMSYTRLADVYLGDASSQIYEFLRRPRPCLFLNSHGHDWRGDPNFAHWQAGPVIDDPAALEVALPAAIASHATRYRTGQQALFTSTFDLADQPSSLRAAEVIARIATSSR